MKVEKIDIKKELLDVPDNRDRVDFIEREPLSAYMIKEGEMPPNIEMSASKKTYLIQRVGHFKKIIKNYLVAIDDRELFNELIQITDDLLNRAVDKKTDFWKDRLVEELDRQKWEIKRQIKKLSWYRRLFNKF